jgi:predicted metal-dependent hydrolase
LFSRRERIAVLDFYNGGYNSPHLAMTDPWNDCSAPLHPQAAEGLRLFNAGKYFEAHEALERAWLEERGKVRDLYRGILQIGVVYLHITRGNYNGAVKVYGRSLKWLKDWTTVCRGIYVEELRKDAEHAIEEVKRLGKERIGEFDLRLLKPVRWREKSDKHNYVCDRCGSEMHEMNCKVTCPNCGNRFDCSDLNIYFD